MRRNAPALLFGALAALFLLFFFAWPLLVIMQRSLGDTSSLLRILTDPWYLERAGFTLMQALLSTFLTLLVGLPGAVLFARYDFPGRRLLRTAFTIPFVMPTVVAGMGFLALVGPRGLSGVNLRDTLLIILLAHVFYNCSLVIRIVGSYLESVAPRLQEAATTLGAGPWRTFVRVTLPVARPAILAASALVFTLTFTSFGVIVLLAPSYGTLEVEIYRLTARLLQLDAAAVLVLLQLVIVLAVTIAYTRAQARLAVSVTGSPAALVRPGPVAGLWLTLSLLPPGLLTLAPLVALLWQTLATGAVQNFTFLLTATPTAAFPGAGRAIVNSLLIAGGSALVALAVGFCFAYAVVRARLRWLDGTSLLPLATSAITLGFGYLIAFPQLTVSPVGLVLAHSLIGFPFVARSILPALRGIPPGLGAAASMLGASSWTVLRRVDLPLLVPALLSAAAFAFAISMGEFGASLVITRPEFATIPVAIFDRLGRPGAANYGSALALSVLLMAITAAVMLLLERRSKSEL